jgi:hypothetical protein
MHATKRFCAARLASAVNTSVFFLRSFSRFHVSHFDSPKQHLRNQCFCYPAPSKGDLDDGRNVPPERWVQADNEEVR